MDYTKVGAKEHGVVFVEYLDHSKPELSLGQGASLHGVFGLHIDIRTVS
jgi:hypothetical protein